MNLPPPPPRTPDRGYLRTALLAIGVACIVIAFIGGYIGRRNVGDSPTWTTVLAVAGSTVFVLAFKRLIPPRR